MDKDQHIKLLKYRIQELKTLIDKHAEILNGYKKIYSPYVDRDIEEMRILRMNTLQRTKIEPEDL